MKIERNAQRVIYLLTQTQMRRRAQAAPDAGSFFASDSALFLSLAARECRQKSAPPCNRVFYMHDVRIMRLLD